jgi:hypothetical protein
MVDRSGIDIGGASRFAFKRRTNCDTMVRLVFFDRSRTVGVR